MLGLSNKTAGRKRGHGAGDDAGPGDPDEAEAMAEKDPQRELQHAVHQHGNADARAISQHGGAGDQAVDQRIEHDAHSEQRVECHAAKHARDQPMRVTNAGLKISTPTAAPPARSRCILITRKTTLRRRDGGGASP